MTEMKRFVQIFLMLFASVFLLQGCSSEDKGRAKYIFLFVGDGMGFAHISATESYLSYKNNTLGGEKLLFSKFPYVGIATTHSANRNVTCSSAAGTAIACGEKANNNTVGINKDSVALKSVAYELRDMGYRIGIVTNVGVNHSTPATFYANNSDRHAYYDISTQISKSGFDFFAGSGFYEPKGKDGSMEAIDKYLENRGYGVGYGVDEFKTKSLQFDKVVFCQERSRIEKPDYYTGNAKREEDIALDQMLRLGLEHIGDEQPMFIMCEGGNIDWASHNNKTMALVANVIEFETAIKVAYDFYMNHKDKTLIVVTADHETGGLTLGYGQGNEHPTYETIDWKTLEEHWISNGNKNTLSKDDNRKLNQECSIGWTSSHHTGGAVPVFAIGRGAEKFAGRMDNTDIKSKILGQ